MSYNETLTLDVVTTEAGLHELRGAWEELSGKTPLPNVFLTWGWVTTWWEHFGSEGTLHVVVFRDSAGIAAIAPMQVSTISCGPVRARILERINPEAGDYGGILVARRVHDVADALADHIAETLSSLSLAAAIVSRIPSDVPFLAAWRDATRRKQSQLATEERLLEGACYYTDVRDDFRLSRKAKKHKVRQRLRRLNEAYDDVTFTYHTGETLQVGIEHLLEVHRRRWSDRKEKLQGLLAEPDREAFMLDAIAALDEKGLVRLLSVVADGRPVAVELDFRLRDRAFMFKGAFDPEFSQFSPGHLLHHRVFEDGMGEGLNVFDFGRGDQPYKSRWANGERYLFTTTHVRRGVRGKLANQRLRLCRSLAVRFS